MCRSYLFRQKGINLEFEAAPGFARGPGENRLGICGPYLCKVKF